MSAVLRIHLEVADLVQLGAELSVVGMFEGERPLRGPAGRVDWRLCGLLSELVAGGSFEGQPGEALMLASAGRVGAPALLVIGLGPRGRWGVPAFEAANREAFERIGRLGHRRVALAPLGLDDDEVGRHARAFVDSALAGLGGRGLDLHLSVADAEEARVRRELIRAAGAERVEIVPPRPQAPVEPGPSVVQSHHL